MQIHHRLQLQIERLYRRGGMRFANYRTWLSSDYMLNALSYDPATTQQRLGDGFYEQRLIREQVAQLTGRRYLGDYASDETEYQALMNNGVTYAQTYNLRPGIALSPDQIAALTSDIVWLVTQTVTLPDGSTQQVLVPQLYVRLQANDLQPSGALIAANDIQLNLAGDLNNKGTIAGRHIVDINANNINNLGGKIAASNVRLTAAQDINNLGGTLAAVDNLILNAGHDINIASTISSQSNAQGSRTNINRVAGLYVTGENGTLIADAGHDLNLIAAVVQNQGANGATLLKANNDINLGTVTESNSQSNSRNSKNYLRTASSTDVGSQISAQSDLTLSAGHNLNAQAADVTSEQGNLIAIAGNDINLTTGEATTQASEGHTSKKSGFLSSTKKTTRSTVDDITNIATNLSGNQVLLQSGQDINITGSSVVSDNGTTLNAQNNINLIAAQDVTDETHYKKVKTSGFSTSGASISYGTSQLKNTSDIHETTNVASTVGSINGDVNINAGNHYQQTGSDVLAPAGDINITAKDVDITAATDTYNRVDKMSYKKTGITLAISSPVISAIQTASQMSQAASKTSDPRMKALAAATTALSVKNAANAVQAGQGTTINDKPGQIATGKDAAGNPTSRDANAADQAGGIDISLSIGTSKSSSTQTQTNTTASSSHVTAGGDINIKATGADTSTGATSDINIIGSQIKANGDVSLIADHNINLMAAENVDTLKGKNNSSSASIGVSFGTSGFLVTASASGGKGKTTGSGTTWTETTVQSGNHAGDKVTLNSGADTNLIGAQVAGNQVIANVGINPTTGEIGQGNLNIQSLQDTDDYKSKQQSIGGSISVGAGTMGGSFNYSASNIKSNYTSVNEQSGIMAGDGGFQVNVAGNTNLTGAVIASSQTAIDNQKNSLTTETLTVSNIENKAAYKADSMSVGGGYSVSGNNVGLKDPNAVAALPYTPSTVMVGTNQQGQATTGGAAIPGTTLGSLKGLSATIPSTQSASDHSSSTTISGVSIANINITDTAAQSALTGQDADATVATLNQNVHTNISTDAQGNTTYTVVDSQGNNTAHQLDTLYTDEVKANIQAGFAITQAFTQQVGTFLNNRAAEVQAARQAIENELKKPEDQQDIYVIQQAGQVIADNAKWSMGGTGRIALTAITAAFSGNVTGSGSSLIQAATVTAIQSLGAQQIKAIADLVGGEGSPAHTALHAVLACAGAAATGGDCGTAALAASSGVVINTLLDSVEGTNSQNLTDSEKEARLNLITTLVTGITAAAGGDAAVANTAVTIETENNALFVKGTTARIQVAGIMVANVLNKPQGTLTRQELIATLNNLAKYYDAKDLTIQEALNLNSMWLALLSNNPTLLTSQEVLNSKEFLQLAITSMAANSGSGSTSITPRGSATGPRLPGTDSEFVPPATNSTGVTASSVQAARLNMQLSAEQAAGIRAPTSITSYTTHINEQIAGRDGGIGVNQVAIDDAFANPVAIQYAPSTYGPTFKYVGKNATVVVNPYGTVVTAWGTSAAGVGK